MELVWENIVLVWALPPLLEKFRRFESFEPTEVTFTLRKSKTETLGHTRKVLPPPWYKGWGVDGTPLKFFICCSISKRFCYKWKDFDLLQKTRYIIWVVALLEVCEVIKHGRHLGFYQELEIR